MVERYRIKGVERKESVGAKVDGGETKRTKKPGNGNRKRK